MNWRKRKLTKNAYEECLTMEKLNIEKIRIESEMGQKAMDIDKTVELGEMHKTLMEEKGTNNLGNIKLPRLDLAKFDGNIFKWQEFYDTYVKPHFTLLITELH